MSDQQVQVTFRDHGRAAYVLPGTKIIEAAARVGLAVGTPCGGKGTCGKCRVQVLSGAGEPVPAEREVFSSDELAAGWRLACQASVSDDAVIAIPESSLFADVHQILTATTDEQAEIIPSVRKVYVELPASVLKKDRPDLLCLEKSIGRFEADDELLDQLPKILRESGCKVTAVLADSRLIGFEPGDTSDKCYGLAFDIGTTTIAGALVDVRNGDELAVTSAMNPQVSFGDDVLSRIRFSETSGDGLGELHEALVGGVVEMIDRLCTDSGVDRSHIYEIVFAGNTTMQHLLCRIDPAPLGRVPFVPVSKSGLMLSAGQLSLGLNQGARAYVFPVIGGFVGGDTVAGLLATKLDDSGEAAIMVDIGTNGEIVLAHGGRIWAASTAAGPAFEGARISCGMRASAGAVEKVVFDGGVHCSVIGNLEPAGLCGSGLIDLAAELLTSGVVTPTGRMLGPDELSDSLDRSIRDRVIRDESGQVRFVLADGEKAQADVALTQKDIRELQLGAGAIRAGIRILLKQADLAAGELSEVLIAGGFGSFIRRNHAQRIGLLPKEVDHDCIHYVGNAALSGAKWVLLSTEARSRAEKLAREVQHVELSADADFQEIFAESMIFPQQ